MQFGFISCQSLLKISRESLLETVADDDCRDFVTSNPGVFVFLCDELRKPSFHAQMPTTMLLSTLAIAVDWLLSKKHGIPEAPQSCLRHLSHWIS
jgi:hypothetical protein